MFRWIFIFVVFFFWDSSRGQNYHVVVSSFTLPTTTTAIINYHTIKKMELRIQSRDSALSSSSSASSSSSSSSSSFSLAVPFFASSTSTPSSSSSSSSSSNNNNAGVATITYRLPLGTIFDGREYTFVTESNVRSYEWTTQECDLLLEDFIDAANIKHHPSVPIHDYELSQIVIVPTSKWDSNTYGLGNQYDVHDGQQRLVTLNLLFASLRDAFHVEATRTTTRRSNSSSSTSSSGAGGKRAVALTATAEEIARMLLPTKVRKLDVRRIALRPRDDIVLEYILLGNMRGDSIHKKKEEEDEEIGGQQQEEEEEDATNHEKKDDVLSLSSLDTHEYSQLTTQQTTQLLSNLTPANQRIFHNFVYYTKRISTLNTREKLRLLDYIVERVHLLVCIPETSRIARNIVLNQHGRRKGMENEPIDDFKGLVCFRYTMEEEDMHRTFDDWDILAASPPPLKGIASTSVHDDGIRKDNNDDDDDTVADTTSAARPSSSDNSSSGSSSRKMLMTSVGRETLSSACLLRASAALRTKIRSSRDRGGGDEVYELERWLRQRLTLRNNQRMENTLLPAPQITDGNTNYYYWQGKDFFVEEIVPASTVLHKFRAGLWDEFGFLTLMAKKQKDTIVSRLNFLRDLILGVPAANEAEIFVLDYLLHIEDDFKASGKDDSDDDDSSTMSRHLDEILSLMEQCTLWMAIMRPSSMQRQICVYSMLDTIQIPAREGNYLDTLPMGVNAWRMSSLREAIYEYKFGANAAGKRLAGAILKRLNSHLLIEEKKNIPDCVHNPPKVESIFVSEWASEDDRMEWAHRIGNLALVSSSTPTLRKGRGKKPTDSPWETNIKKYKKEPWTLTRQLADLEQWDVKSIREQQRDVLSLMDIVWAMD